MTPLDVARLDFELHSDLLLRALGCGGARIDLIRAQAELEHTGAALDALATEIVKATQCPAHS
jgi:hypothetical protein